MACNNCAPEVVCPDPCEPCVEQVRVPLPLCYLVEPCNTGCVDTISTDCIIISKSAGPFFKGMTLTQGLEALSSQLSALARVYNQTGTPHLINYSFSAPDGSFSIEVKRNNVTVINTSYSSLNTLLNDLQAVEMNWSLSGNTFYVGGTSTWSVTIN